jgi:hypothetical protein
MNTLHRTAICITALAALVAGAYGCSDDDSEGNASEIDSGRGGGGNENGNGGAQADASVSDGPVIDPDVAQGGSGPEEEACGTELLEATHRQVNVLLVIDKSGSMSEQPEGWSSADKWSALASALDEALSAVQEHMWFGMLLYPYPAESTAAACEQQIVESENWVDMAEGTTSVPTILSTLESITPSGGTPTAAALAQAYDYFTNGDGADLEGDKVVLLATDGAPNCNAELTCDATSCVPNIDGICPEEVTNCCDADPGQCLDDTATVGQIETLEQEGISTFVVGIPGSEAYATTLDEMALAGGVPNTEGTTDYFEVDVEGGAEGLADVLIEITRDLITSCELQLTSVPPDLDKVNVEIENERVPQEPENGWELDETTDPPTVVLKGETCSLVENEGVESIDITFGCPTELPQ